MFSRFESELGFEFAFADGNYVEMMSGIEELKDLGLNWNTYALELYFHLLQDLKKLGRTNIAFPQKVLVGGIFVATLLPRGLG
jgi:hypothetical protein